MIQYNPSNIIVCATTPEQISNPKYKMALDQLGPTSQPVTNSHLDNIAEKLKGYTPKAAVLVTDATELDADMENISRLRESVNNKELPVVLLANSDITYDREGYNKPAKQTNDPFFDLATLYPREAAFHAGRVSGLYTIETTKDLAERCKMLIAEDDPAIFEILPQMLTMAAGLQDVEIHKRGEDVLDAYKKAEPGTYSLIMTDFGLEGDIDGGVLTEEIRKHNYDIPILCLTASPQQNTDKMLEAEADYVFGKPVSIEELVAITLTAIGQNTIRNLR